MTIVVAISRTGDASVIADCRLSWPSPTGETIRRDVCQKLVVANGWSVVGIAGNLCMARHHLNGVVNRLRETEARAPDWLKDDDLLKDFIAQGCRNHARRWGAGHEVCAEQAATLIIAWMDWSRSIVSPAPGSDDAPFVPGTEIIVVRSPELEVRRTRMGLDVIGTPSVAPRMRDEAFSTWLYFARWGEEYGEAHRALLVTQMVRDMLGDRGGVPAVGGLFQVATLSRSGVGAVPYF